jgi:hypothetical protein
MPKEFGNQPQQIVQQEARPQISPERQPLPSVSDILERKAQLGEIASARHETGQMYSREENSAFDKMFGAKQRQLGNELATLYAKGTASDRLIIETYTTLARPTSSWPAYWTNDISPQKIRAFIVKFQSPMSEDELREELRKAQEALERKTEAYKKMVENHRLYTDFSVS